PTPVSKPTPRPPSLTDDHKLQLIWFCKDTVRKFLKAPSTAAFPGEILRFEDYKFINQGSGREYLVTSWVDAENAFGAKLRQRWKVLVVPEFQNGGLKSVTAVYVQIGEDILWDRRAEHYQTIQP